MNTTIYTGPGGVKAILTTESPASHHGVPALRAEGKGVEDWPDMGAADVLGSGFTAAALVYACAMGRLPEGVGGRVHRMSAATREAARRFLAQ